jgi:L-asparaginase
MRTGQELLAQVGNLQGLAEVEVHDFAQLPSSQVTLEKAMELAVLVRDYLDDETVAGVVVTHGTDTLEETAYLLDLLVASKKPVVVTGAMRNGAERGAEGPRNLYASILTVLSTGASGQGTLVVMNDTVHAARDVTKDDSKNPAAFTSPCFGPLGRLEQHRVIWGRRRLSQRRYPEVTQLEPRVALMSYAAGTGPRVLEKLAELELCALVVETAGAGAFPPGAREKAEQLARSGLHVVAATRCTCGTVGPGINCGPIIAAGDLGGAKARLLTMVALGAGADAAGLRKAFGQTGRLTESLRERNDGNKRS